VLPEPTFNELMLTTAGGGAGVELQLKLNEVYLETFYVKHHHS
jgi:hypothetical protein